MKYIVVNENMLGYVDNPNKKFLQMGVLASLITEGAAHQPIDGPYPLNNCATNYRPATKYDFERFRVKIPPDFS